MKTNLKIASLFGLLIAIFLFVSLWYVVNMVLTSNSQVQKYNATKTPYLTLLKDNPAFIAADAYFNAGNYTSAIAKYREALVLATDSAQVGQIQYQIALSTERMGDLQGAVPLYQAIGENKEFYGLIRAFAVQKLGIMLLTGSSESARSAIFALEPYKSFLQKRSGNQILATVDLFNHSISLYPLAVPLLVSANADLWRVDIPANMSTSTLVAQVQAKIAKADSDIARSKSNPNEASIVPLALRRRAVVEGILAVVGGVSPSEADAAFELAMTANAAFGPGMDGYDRFNYASYLLYTADKNKTLIHQLLSPFYSDQNYAKSPVVAYFIAEKRNSFRTKYLFPKLVVADPPFKAYLISLGWDDADFK